MMKHKRAKNNCLAFSLLIILFINNSCSAQQKTGKIKIVNIPSEPAYWDTTATKVKFVNYKGIKAIKMAPHSNEISVKGINFSNGTIEFDTQPIDAETRSSGPIGIYFRQQNAKESEYMYLRTKKDDTKRNDDDIQYAPIVNGVLLFNMMSHFDGPAPVHNKEWNHVKLVVYGMQMRVYVNDMNEPVLEIPRLESNSTTGSIGFDGLAYIANLVIKPNETEGLSPVEGIDPAKHDVNYVRRWDVTSAQLMAQGRELTDQDLPKDTTKWTPIVAERRGVINLSRKFGSSDTGRYVWLKTTINSTKEQVVQMQLGFCDEVYVFVNKKLVDADKNQFGLPLSKFPDGCLNIDNSTINIPLKEGNNELLIGVVNNFYSWAIVARMRNLHNLAILQQ
jgi:hypothetical protein